jgi:DNA-binding PadR family transcriptional regulator
VTDPALLILASLADGDKHGYAMMVDIERFAGVRLGPGTLYGAITRLEEQGWIVPVKSEDRRKPYRLTADGRSYLEEQMTSLDRLVKAAQQRLSPA